MQILSDVTHEILVKTQVAPFLDLDFVSSWVEFSGSTIENPELVPASLTGTFDDNSTTIIAPPTSGNQSQVKFISLHNNDGIQHRIFVFFTTSRLELNITLETKETLFYVDSRGWYILTANGSIKTFDSSSPQDITRVLLSGSTNGKPIAVAATATPGTLIHTAAALPVIDEIWIWVTNRTGAAETLTLEWGGVTNADHVTEALSIPANSSPILLTQGLILTNSLIVRAFSGTASALNISGYVNRIT